MDRQTLLDQRTKLVDRANSLKTKKAKSNAWVKVREIERQLADLCKATISPYVGKRLKGTVLYSGSEVLIKTEFGTMQLNACNDILSKSWHNSTCCVSYTEGQEVEFELYIAEYTWKGFESIPYKVTGGVFDQKKYDRLCLQLGYDWII